MRPMLRRATGGSRASASPETGFAPSDGHLFQEAFDLGAQIGCGRFDGFGCVEHGLRRSARFGRSASYFVEHRYNLVRLPGSACHVMRNLSGRGILLLHRRGHSCGKLLDLLHAIGDLPGFCLFDERDLRRRRRAQRRRRVLTAAERNATLLGVLMCLPTAPALPPGENGDFGMSPICGQLLHKPLLAFVYSRGVRDIHLHVVRSTQILQSGGGRNQSERLVQGIRACRLI